MTLLLLAALAVATPPEGAEAPPEEVAPEPEVRPVAEPEAEPADEASGPVRPHERAPLARRLPRDEQGLRTMSRHAFIPPQGFDDAFATSHFGLETGASFLSLPRFVSDDDEPYDLLLAGAHEALSVSVQFLGWIQLHAEGEGDLVVGINTPSAIDQGARAGGAWDVGVGTKLFRVKRTGTQMSLRAKFVGEEGLRLRPESVLEGIDRRTDGSFEDLSEEELSTILLGEGELGGGGSINLAQAFGPWGSLQASVEGAGGQARAELIDDTDPDDVQKVLVQAPYLDLHAGLALTFDGWPYFPVGLQLEYGFGWSRTFLADGASDLSVHEAGGGLFYTGHPDFVIGVRGGAVVASSLDVTPLAASAGILFRAYL